MSFSEPASTSPFRLIERPLPDRRPAPLILASPHSGRDYPAAFLAQTRLATAHLRRAEDAYVDRLLADAVSCGVPLLAANYGRSYLDLNRDPRELDPAMIAEPLPPDPAQASERVAAGLGILPRMAAAGLDIYATKLPLAEAEARIASVHRPYHDRLAALIAQARAAHGYAVLLDCHSMPTPTGTAAAPQFVLGDLFGRSAAYPLVAHIETALTRAGFRVARNMPYAGGYTTAHYGDPDGGVHVVQLEIDRALYMDPARLAPHAGFGTITTLLGHLVAGLLAALPALGLGPPMREAAE